MTSQNIRSVSRIINAHRQLEGGGFVVRRPFPGPAASFIDPFLLLDEMGPVDYAPGEAIGAPDHPHRGFETVTYVLEGEGEHQDSAGHRGVIGPGAVQWMTAGSGVVHAEMPSRKLQREGGRMHGFQIWVNLPAADKMIAPRYQEITAESIPSATSADGLARVRVLAGEALGVGAAIDTRTPIALHDWTVSPGGAVETPLPAAMDASVYCFGGEVLVGAGEALIHDGQLAVLSAGDTLRLEVSKDAKEPARILVLAGTPLREPVARYGPFVMNTEAQIRTAFADYQAGRMGTIQRGQDQGS